MAAGESTSPSAPAPAAATLERLPAGDWALLLSHVRAVMNGLEHELLTPRMLQLRAVPDRRLATGRSRRDLSELLAGGGLLWRETVQRLREDGEASRRLGWLLRGEEPPAPPPRPNPREPAGQDEADPERDSREERLRARARQLVAQRDEARRRATGLEARLAAERERRVELEDELERVRAERDELARKLEEAAAERAQALERLSRQSDAQLAAAREELRALRRAEEERRERRRHRQPARHGGEAGESAQRGSTRVSRRAGPRLARPGRPSRLPPGVVPGSVEAAVTLLTPGRRVLVDGYNVTKQHRDHVPLEQQRLWLIRLLEGLAARRKVRPVVVFDGDSTAAPLVGSSKQVSVVFSVGGSADDEIVEMVAALPSDEPVVVVTDDRELTERVNALHADAIRTRPFVEVAQ